MTEAVPPAPPQRHREGGGLRAGAARVDITPGELGRTFLAGFGLDRRAQGVLEPLEASALFLESCSGSAALVSVDVLGLPRVWVDAIRRRVRRLPDARRALCCATHTHSGPDTLGLWGRGLFGRIPRSSGVDPRYMESLVSRVAACIDGAAEAARPARLRAASFEIPEDWTRNDRKGGGRYDHAVALAIEEPSGARIATVLNFASHPETLWNRNRLVSPDFPGAFRRRSAGLAGGTPLYLSGPLGAMLTPNVSPDADLPERRRYAEALGSYLAERAEAELEGAEPLPVDGLRHAVHEVELVNENWRFRLFQRIGMLESTARDGRVSADLHHLRLGDVECLTAPGEVAPELGQRMRGTMRRPHRLVLGLCDDELGYVLEPGMFDDREYRYEQTMSLGRGTAEALMDSYRRLVSEDRR